MKILHILNDKPNDAISKLIEAQSKENDIQVVEMGQADLSYDALVDQIVDCDKVVSWNNSADGHKH